MEMHDALQKEIATYEKRTPKSAAAHKRALQRIPLGVASNYRHYEPYPIFVKDGKAGRIHDVDGNEYVDHNLCFGALMAGHCHPAVVKAVEQKLHEGTTFGMPHEQEWELAEEICARYPVDMVRFGSSGTEVTMHAVRIARRQQRNDVRMLKSGSRSDLTLEPLDRVLRHDVGRQGLDDDFSSETAIRREVDAGHAATTELALELVGRVEGRGETFERGVGQATRARGGENGGG
jgi:hypothetical protein